MEKGRKVTFKDYLEENILNDVLNLGSKYLYFWKDTWVLNTKHGLERILQRSTLKPEQLKKLFKSAIEKAKSIGAKVGENILFFSRSLNQGFVSSIAKDGIHLITFLPPGKSFAKDDTKKVVTESMDDGSIVEHQIHHFVEID
jgi:hypothetical protein